MAPWREKKETPREAMRREQERCTPVQLEQKTCEMRGHLNRQLQTPDLFRFAGVHECLKGWDRNRPKPQGDPNNQRQPAASRHQLAPGALAAREWGERT